MNINKGRERERERERESPARSMAQQRALLAAFTMALLLLAGMASADSKGKEEGKGKGNDDDKGKNKKGFLDPASTNYIVLDPVEETQQQRFFCLARGKCRFHVLKCPAECPQRKPRRNKRVKACFPDCSSRCETTCKRRKANCKGFGSVCYDPRFVGGDGVMFYFHGTKGADYALVSDDLLQINGHLIGTRPEDRNRDFTWVQALAIMFDSHTLVVAARWVAQWDDAVDALAVRWDGKEVDVPTDGDEEWKAPADAGYEDERAVVVERTEMTNSVKVKVSGLLELDVRVTTIGEVENRTHGYRLPAGDAFAHLETQFRFSGLSDKVEGVLGQTYRPGYVSQVKKGVPMPMMGGEDKYRLPSFLSSTCFKCRFSRRNTIHRQPFSSPDDLLVTY